MGICACVLQILVYWPVLSQSRPQHTDGSWQSALSQSVVWCCTVFILLRVREREWVWVYDGLTWWVFVYLLNGHTKSVLSLGACLLSDFESVFSTHVLYSVYTEYNYVYCVFTQWILTCMYVYIHLPVHGVHVCTYCVTTQSYRQSHSSDRFCSPGGSDSLYMDWWIFSIRKQNPCHNEPNLYMYGVM
jgi:hypothetical protein